MMSSSHKDVIVLSSDWMAPSYSGDYESAITMLRVDGDQESSICHFSFRLFCLVFVENFLIIHVVTNMNSQDGVNHFKCFNVLYLATKQGHLKTHIKSEKIKYSCNQCDQQFTRQESLKTHNQSVHEKIKYSCN